MYKVGDVVVITKIADDGFYENPSQYAGRLTTITRIIEGHAAYPIELNVLCGKTPLYVSDQEIRKATKLDKGLT